MASDQISLPAFLWGPDKLERRQKLLPILSAHPLLKRENEPIDPTRQQLWELRVRQSKVLIEEKFKNGWTRQEFLEATQLVGDVIPATFQYRIFIKNIEAQMSPEQKAYWLPKAERFEILGCYAQTEIGHGSNLRGIETTATYDPKIGDFILHSPTETSIKFWIGGLGCWATHAIVVARLMIKDKDYGNHLFMVQIRDLDTHQTLPGVSIYEIGAKALGALSGVDNGAVRFEHVRVPLNHMFQGVASVSRDGTYETKTTLQAHSLRSMVIIRGLMTEEIGFVVAKALFIASKYLMYRQQFRSPGKDSDSEKAVLEYSGVAHRLFPALCRAVVIITNGRRLAHDAEYRLNGDTKALHLRTVAGKVYATEHAARDAAMAQRLCGGHGMIAAAQLGALYSHLNPARTYEGDNYVLSLQIGRAIKKKYTLSAAGTLVTDDRAFSYLRLLGNGLSTHRVEFSLPVNWNDTTVCEYFLEQRCALLASDYLRAATEGSDASHLTMDLTMAHAELIYWRGFETVQAEAEPHLKAMLSPIHTLFSFGAIKDGLRTFFGRSNLDAESISRLDAAHTEAVDAFRSIHQHILDGFNFTEYETNSVFHRHQMSPYEALLHNAKASPLTGNQSMAETIIEARNVWRRGLKGKSSSADKLCVPHL